MCEAYETGARALGKFCYLVRSQISSFFFDNAKVRKIQSTSKLFLKKGSVSYLAMSYKCGHYGQLSLTFLGMQNYLL